MVVFAVLGSMLLLLGSCGNSDETVGLDLARASFRTTGQLARSSDAVVIADLKGIGPTEGDGAGLAMTSSQAVIVEVISQRPDNPIFLSEGDRISVAVVLIDPKFADKLVNYDELAADFIGVRDLAKVQGNTEVVLYLVARPEVQVQNNRIGLFEAIAIATTEEGEQITFDAVPGPIDDTTVDVSTVVDTATTAHDEPAPWREDEGEPVEIEPIPASGSRPPLAEDE